VSARGKIEVKDHLVRKFDQNQIAVGSFMDISPAHKHCFMARLNKYGEIIDSTYVKHIYAAT
jgi:hypothetical protein